jgi:tRNA threonylcarbamoyladenosine biosynthesis protein TsaE
MKIIELNSLGQIQSAAQCFLNLTKGYSKFAFYGDMGSGKTTFIKALCKELGAVDTVTSPTFALINEYETSEGFLLYHLDLYRINSVEELFDLGYEDYFFGNNLIFIEWPEKAESILPDSFVKIYMEVAAKNKRVIKLNL